jgi:sulfur carrier protein ThiS adenylyltransferase
VAIVGLGGLGSTIAVALARAGVGHLKLIDFDRVDLSNLNRQQYRIQDIGRLKTEALSEILKEINPYLDVTTYAGHVNEENGGKLLENVNIICEATDVPETKSMLVDLFFTHFAETKKLVAGSGMAGYESSNLIHTRKVCKNFYLCGDEKNGLEDGMPLMAPRVGVCAAHEANMILRLLLGEEKA